MRFELLGWAPDEASMWTYLKGAKWAKVVKDDKGANMDVTADGVQLDIVGPVVEYDNSDPPVKTKDTGGVHFNIRFHDEMAERLTDRLAQTKVVDGEVVPEELFKRTRIKTDIEKELVRVQTMKTRTAEGVKEGYEDSTTKVRIFDPTTITKRHRVWA